MVAWGRELTASFTAVARIPKPVIAAVTGYALGGGYELALCADFRVLGTNAKVGQPEILLGVIPGAGGTQRLARLVGPAKAKDLVFTGRHVGAEEALEWGSPTPSSRTTRCTRPRSRWPASSPPARRWRWPPPSRPSTRGSTGTWTPVWRWRAGCSPGSSTPRTRRPGCARFLENGPGKATFTGR